MLYRDSRRLIAHNNELWDGDRCEAGLALLPVTDDDVRRDINHLLVHHQQRDLPPERPKAAKKKKEASK